MVQNVADRVKDTSTTTGTSDFTVSGTPGETYQTLNDVLATSDTFGYCIEHLTEDEWEVGLGTYSGSHVFVRTTVYAGSNGTSHVDFSAGDKNVMIVQPAGKTIIYKPGSDTDQTLLQVNVTGTPKMEWDESDDRFLLDKGLAVGGNVALLGDISPAQITSNQNDYSPTGLLTATVLRLSTDATRNITGIALGTDGRVLALHNVGGELVILKKDDGATSTAANRLALPYDRPIKPDEVVLIQYDGTSQRWRELGHNSARVVVSATAPTDPVDGELWFDTTVGALYVYINDGDTSQWIEAGYGGSATSLTAANLATAIPAFGMDAPINLGLAASVAGNALTIAIKGADGNDPSAANPVLIPFRSPTEATGTPVIRSLSAATSLVVSSGSTLGTANSTAFRLWIVLFDDGGTLRLGVINCRSGINIFPLDDGIIAPSTAEGGAGAADSAQVFYTNTAVTSKAYRILGYMEWSSGLATAGTWSGGPTKIQLFGPGVKKPGELVQRAIAVDGAVATGTTSIPHDDSIPQNTEGDQYMSQAITPTSAANLLDIEHMGMYSGSAQLFMATALFQDSVANALAAISTTCNAAGLTTENVLRHTMLAATTSSTTFKIRSGQNGAATMTFNGTSGSRRFGGVAASRLIVGEIMA